MVLKMSCMMLIINTFDLAKAGSFFEMEKCSFGSIFVPDPFNIR